MRTTRITTDPKCPVCSSVLNAATAGPANPDAMPGDGDVTVCIRCAATLLFVKKGRKLSLRVPTEAEQPDLQRDVNLAQVKASIIRASRDPVNGWELK